MDYVNNTLNYLKSSLDAIKSAIINIKDVLSAIGSVIATIVDILGFIGFRVFILLLSTAFIVWILNLVSPISRKTNYFVAVGLVLWIAITAKTPIQVVVLKYVLIIISPFIITKIANYLVNNLGRLFRIFWNKIQKYFSKISFSSRKVNKINLSENIGLLFTSDLPTIEEIEFAKNYIQSKNYNILILENEKISLVNEEKQIIFSNDLKFNQLIKSIDYKDVKLLWFWSEFLSANEFIGKLRTIKKIKQNKYIIGDGDNSFILNFLQSRWGWKVIYGYNLKQFINSNVDSSDLNLMEEIFVTKHLSLSLINDFDLTDGYFIKEKIVGSDLFVLVNEIGTFNQLGFDGRILFLDGIAESVLTLYRALNHLLSFMIDYKKFPKAIVLGNLNIKNGNSISTVIEKFSNALKESEINIPIFQIKNFKFIELGGKCVLEYSNGEILLISI